MGWPWLICVASDPRGHVSDGPRMINLAVQALKRSKKVLPLDALNRTYVQYFVRA